MTLWQIKKISNGYVLSLPNGQEEFLDTWEDVLKRLKETKA